MDAALASLLEIELDDMPHFSLEKDDEEWWKKIQGWLFEHGYQLLRVEMVPQQPWYLMPAEPLCIIVGRTAKGTPHACVGYAENKPMSEGLICKIIHDPADRDGVESVDALMFLVPVNPVRQKIMGGCLNEIIRRTTLAHPSAELVQGINELARTAVGSLIDPVGFHKANDGR